MKKDKAVKKALDSKKLSDAIHKNKYQMQIIDHLLDSVAVLDIDPIWSSETLSARIASVIETIRLIPNKTTKVTPFEAHFGRKPNTELSNMLTKPSIKNLSYEKLNSKCLDKKLLRQDALTQEEMWRRDGSSEEELDIQYNRETAQITPLTQIDFYDSRNQPIITKSPSKITPSGFHFSIEDKTTKIIYNNKKLLVNQLLEKPKNHKKH